MNEIIWPGGDANAPSMEQCGFEVCNKLNGCHIGSSRFAFIQANLLLLHEVLPGGRRVVVVLASVVSIAVRPYQRAIVAFGNVATAAVVNHVVASINLVAHLNFFFCVNKLSRIEKERIDFYSGNYARIPCLFSFLFLPRLSLSIVVVLHTRNNTKNNKENKNQTNKKSKTICTNISRIGIFVMVYFGALGRVPRIRAASPRQLAGKRREEKVQRPGYDDIIEEVHVERDQNHAHSHSCAGRIQCRHVKIKYKQRKQ